MVVGKLWIWNLYHALCPNKLRQQFRSFTLTNGIGHRVYPFCIESELKQPKSHHNLKSVISAIAHLSLHSKIPLATFFNPLLPKIFHFRPAGLLFTLAAEVLAENLATYICN
jgi:hypothetical protein